jgi:hypothetical protein
LGAQYKSQRSCNRSEGATKEAANLGTHEAAAKTACHVAARRGDIGNGVTGIPVQLAYGIKCNRCAGQGPTASAQHWVPSKPLQSCTKPALAGDATRDRI